jgi:uncharacterized membrane protein
VWVFTAVFGYLSVVRHDDLRSYYFDLGNFDRWIWSVLHGDFSVIPQRLGVHFDPILLAFVPVYAIVAAPKILLVVQSFALGSAAVPVFRLAADKIRDPFVPWIFALSYLAHPAVHFAALYDFHPATLAVPFAAFAFYFLEMERTGWFLLSAGIGMLCKEDVGLIVMMMGLYAVFFKGRRGFGLSVAVICGAFFLVFIGWAVPHFSPSGSSILMGRYQWLGDTPLAVLKTVFLHPLRVIHGMGSFERAFGLVNLIAPIGYIPALGPSALMVALPEFAINLLSSNPMTNGIYYYHWCTTVPFLYFAAVFGTAVLLKQKRSIAPVWIYMVLAGSFILIAVSPASPVSKDPWATRWTVSDHARLLDGFQRLIPAGASLSIQNNLGAHFSQRRDIHVFPKKTDSVEFVLVDVYSPYKGFREREDFEYAVRMELDEYEQAVLKMFGSPDYGIYRFEGGFFLFKRGYDRGINPAALESFRRRMEALNALRSEAAIRSGFRLDSSVSDGRSATSSSYPRRRWSGTARAGFPRRSFCGPSDAWPGSGRSFRSAPG